MGSVGSWRLNIRERKEEDESDCSPHPKKAKSMHTASKKTRTQHSSKKENTSNAQTAITPAALSNLIDPFRVQLLRVDEQQFLKQHRSAIDAQCARTLQQRLHVLMLTQSERGHRESKAKREQKENRTKRVRAERERASEKTREKEAESRESERAVSRDQGAERAEMVERADMIESACLLSTSFWSPRRRRTHPR